jgi:hypothetical protein
MSDKVNLDLCKDLCAVHKEHYGKWRNGKNDHRWLPCDDCKNSIKELSGFQYKKGVDPILDFIYKNGYEDGHYQGRVDSAHPCDFD